MAKGHRVLVLRAAQQASALAEALRQRGLEPVLLAAIETVPPQSWAVLDQALTGLDAFDWLVFTSANAVAATAERLRALGGHAEMPRIAAIGQATAKKVQEQGWRVDLVPEQAVNEALAAALAPMALTAGRPTRFLLPRAEEAREVLPETLREAGAEVVVAPAYRTVIPEGSVAGWRVLVEGKPQVDAVAFTSASTVRNLRALCGKACVDLPDGVLKASIGPITSAALEEQGWRVDTEAKEATVAALAEAVARALTAR